MHYRVWSVVNCPSGVGAGEGRRLLYAVGSPSEACTVIRLLRARREGDPTILTSEYGLEVFRAGRWTEWRDDRGHCVMDFVASTCDEVAVRV